MNCKMQEKMSMEEILYYLMFSLLLSLKGIGLDEGSILFRVGLVCGILLFFVKILIGKYSIRELILIALGLLWGVFIFFNMGSFGILVYALMALGMKNISVSKVMKIGTVVWSTCMALTITAAIFMDRPGVRVVHEKLGLGPILRESLGYGHPNVLHITYILFMVFILYTCKKENMVKTIIFLLVGDIFIFTYSVSYTGLLVSFLAIVIYIYYVYGSRFSNIERIFTKCVLPVCIFLSTVFPLVIDSYGFLYDLFNPLLNNRIWIIKHYFYLYTPTLWGERIMTDGFSLDNSYVYAIGWYGIIFFLFAMFAYWFVVKKYVKDERKKELAIIITFLIAGLTEQFMFNASIKNITFIFLGEVFYIYLGSKGKQISLLEGLNKEYIFTINNTKSLNKKKELLDWKKGVLYYIIINSLVLGVLFGIETNKYESVYVNEKRCECNVQLVHQHEMERNETSLLVGELNSEDQYYYFNKENSNLILIMDFRYKISLSIYISIFIMGCIYVLLSRGKKNEVD